MQVVYANNKLSLMKVKHNSTFIRGQPAKNRPTLINCTLIDEN